MIHSAEEFVSLRTSENRAEYERAGSDEAPLEVWYSVIEQFPDFREWVAHNKTVPLEVLELLARDPSASVRFVVAKKRKLSLKLQIILSADSDASVRHGLACNAKCELDILQELTSDTESFVRDDAAKRFKRRSDAP
jgi:hypothetical protein